MLRFVRLILYIFNESIVSVPPSRLWNEERSMRFELEDEIGNVDAEKEYGGTTGDDRKTLLTVLVQISE
jgi:hypothetical protein